MTFCFRSVNFFCYVCFTGKSENFAETPILKDFFHFSSKWSPFSKMLVFNGDIKFSKRNIFWFWSVNFWWLCFLLVKKIIFYVKSVSFWANELISKYSDKIMSCKLWGKVTRVSVNINFGKKMSILCEKNWNFGRNVKFFIKCALLLKVIIFLQNMPIF